MNTGIISYICNLLKTISKEDDGIVLDDDELEDEEQ